MTDAIDLFFEKPNQTKGYMDAIKNRSNPSDDVSLPEQILPSVNEAEINVMGNIYKGKKIEISGGDIIIDGVKSGTMPITSGTWIKLIRGKHITGVGSYTVIGD